MESFVRSLELADPLHEISYLYQDVLALREESMITVELWSTFSDGYRKEGLDALKFEASSIFNNPSIRAWNQDRSYQADFQMLISYASFINCLDDVDVEWLRLRSYTRIDYDEAEEKQILGKLMKEDPLFDSFSRKLDTFHAFVGILLFFSRFILLPQYFRKATPNEAAQHAFAFYTILDYSNNIFNEIRLGSWGGHQFRPRLEAGLVRKMQLDLLELALECVFRDIKEYLVAIVIDANKAPDVTLWQEKDSFGGRILKSWWLVNFLADNRSESVEARIWRHLQSPE
ncbi:hypothetical protein BJ508DRAFT_85178 [Ascobolus immersus RN42]|uniref:Uncharacterized protein n=1 Tax=Ascobolus immersus RN42 TaxID=1160509 RepID=A0A3N4HBG3_ASCIM|nr:hypothetical protein BJ508DRAFT_85178 [Ascobolus immersus RN42]